MIYKNNFSLFPIFLEIAVEFSFFFFNDIKLRRLFYSLFPLKVININIKL